MVVSRAALVYFNDDQAREKRGEADEVEDEVDLRSRSLLTGRVSGLEDEGGLGG
jgi:hypothetical protein